MGSYNNTSLSGAVFEGDKVVLFAIVPTINQNHGLYKPVSLPIVATYADYGRYDIEPESQENFNSLLNFLNKYHSNEEEITNDNFWELFQENEIKPKLVDFYEGYRNEKKRQFYISSVHKSYFDEVLKQNFDDYMGVRNLDTYLAMVVENGDPSLWEHRKNKLGDLFKRGYTLEELKTLLDLNQLDSLINMLERDQHFNGFFKEEVKKLLPEIVLEKGEIAFKQTENNQLAMGLAQTLQFLKWLNECNLDFVPNNYGGQEYNIEAQEKHLALLEQVVNDKKNIMNTIVNYPPAGRQLPSRGLKESPL